MMSLTKYRESIRIMFGVFWGLNSERIIVQVYCRPVVWVFEFVILYSGFILG